MSKNSKPNVSILDPRLSDVLRTQLKPVQLAALRRTSAQLRSQIPRNKATTKVKICSNDKKTIQLLSDMLHNHKNSYIKNSRTNGASVVNGIHNIINEILPKVKKQLFLSGLDPDPQMINDDCWTKENWAMWFALVMYIAHINNRIIVASEVVIKGFLFMDPNTDTIKRQDVIEKQFATIVQKSANARLTDFVGLIRLFRKDELQAIGF